MAARRLDDPIEPMTLGNMRANGVRALAVSRWQRHHEAVLTAGPCPANDALSHETLYQSKNTGRLNGPGF